MNYPEVTDRWFSSDALTRKHETSMPKTVSVKVMLSYDYCHFEICLGADINEGNIEVDQVAFADNLRKSAARLADKAVEQYKIAKRAAESSPTLARMRHAEILTKSEAERTPEEKAIVKAIADRAWAERRAYDYQDDWRDDD
jgi:hypothetical protein